MNYPAIALLLFLGLAGHIALAEEPGSVSATPSPDCGGVFGLCGYVDVEGEPIAPRRFEIARRFSDGLAAVRIDGVWGYVDRAGAIAVAPRFEAVADFRGERAEALFDGRVGVIDREGAFVIEPRFERAVPFTRDVALVRSAAKETNKTAVSVVGGGLDSLLFGRFALYHAREGALTQEIYEFRAFANRSSGGPADLIWARRDEPDQPYGLMNARGEWVVEPRFGYVQTLYENRAIVRDEGPQGESLWGAVDGTGHVVIPLEHHWLSYFENGYGLVGGPGHFRERKVGLIRPDGTIIGGRLFDEAERPGDEQPARVKEQGIWYGIATDGSLVRAEPDGTVVASCPQGLQLVRSGAGLSVQDKTGRQTLSVLIDRVAYGLRNDDGSVTLSSMSRRELDCRAPIGLGVGDDYKGKSVWTYVRPDGQPLFDPPRFTRTHSFAYGFAVVGTGERDVQGEDVRWGIINEDGEFTMPLGPARIRPLSGATTPDGRAMFALGDGQEFQVIDATGQPVRPRDDRRENEARLRALACRGGARIVADGERFGIEGPDSTELVPTVHRAVGCFTAGVAWAPHEEKRLWCPIGLDGAFRERPACRTTYYPMTVSHHYPERFADDPFENSVLWVRAWLRWGMELRSEQPRWIGDGYMSQGSYSVIPFR